MQTANIRLEKRKYVKHFYRGFELVSYNTFPGICYLIYKDGYQYSGLHLSSVAVACRIIDKHIEGKSLPIIKDITIKDLRPIAEYSNKGYNYLMQM